MGCYCGRGMLGVDMGGEVPHALAPEPLLHHPGRALASPRPWYGAAITHASSATTASRPRRTVA